MDNVDGLPIDQKVGYGVSWLDLNTEVRRYNRPIGKLIGHLRIGDALLDYFCIALKQRQEEQRQEPLESD